MRILMICAALALIGAMSPAAAQHVEPPDRQAAVESPRGFLEWAYENRFRRDRVYKQFPDQWARYRQEAPGNPLEDPELYFEPQLAQAVRTVIERANAEGVMADIGDPFMPGNDYDTKTVDIGNVAITGDTAAAQVNFTRFGENVELHFRLVRTASGWRAFDVLAPGWESGFREDLLGLASLPACALPDAQRHVGVSSREIQRFFSALQEAVRASDWRAVSRMVRYPLSVHSGSGPGAPGPTKVYRDSAALVADADRVFSDNVRAAILSQSCGDIFTSWRGAMIGRGQVWFGADRDGSLGITAINLDAPSTESGGDRAAAPAAGTGSADDGEHALAIAGIGLGMTPDRVRTLLTGDGFRPEQSAAEGQYYVKQGVGGGSDRIEIRYRQVGGQSVAVAVRRATKLPRNAGPARQMFLQALFRQFGRPVHSVGNIGGKADYILYRSPDSDAACTGFPLEFLNLRAELDPHAPIALEGPPCAKGLAIRTVFDPRRRNAPVTETVWVLYDRAPSGQGADRPVASQAAASAPATEVAGGIVEISAPELIAAMQADASGTIRRLSGTEFRITDRVQQVSRGDDVAAVSLIGSGRASDLDVTVYLEGAAAARVPNLTGIPFSAICTEIEAITEDAQIPIGKCSAVLVNGIDPANSVAPAKVRSLLAQTKGYDAFAPTEGQLASVGEGQLSFCLDYDGDTTMAMIQCYGEEATRLDQVMKAIALNLPTPVREELAKTREPWDSRARDRCYQEAVGKWSNGSMAGIEAAGCLQEEYRKRAAWVLSLLTSL